MRFKEDFLTSISGSTIDRLYDTTNGYKSIKQVSDYIGYCWPNIFYLELKTCKGASLPFSNITQYDKLVQKLGILGVRVGVVCWLYEKDIIFYVPISTIKKMKEDGLKSIGVRAINEGYYNIKIIPAEKKRVFMFGDYSILKNLKEGE